MKTLILQRLAHFYHPKANGVAGVMIDPKGYIPFCVTLELPWFANTREISCIPAGIYICERRISPRHGETFEVMDVSNRTDILFHKGNFDDDTKGCILLAESFDRINGEPAIKDSKTALSEFMFILEKESEFRLDLRRPCVNPQYP